MLAYLIEILFWFAEFAAARATTALVAFYAPYQSIKALRSTGQDDDSQWLMFWTLYFLFHIVDTELKWILEYLGPLYYVGKLVFVMYLMFANGANQIFKLVVEPFLDKYEDAIKKKMLELTKVSEAELAEMMSDPAKMASKLAELGSDAAAEIKRLAAEANAAAASSAKKSN